MFDSQLGNAELGNTQLGDVGSSGGGGITVSLTPAELGRMQLGTFELGYVPTEGGGGTPTIVEVTVTNSLSVSQTIVAQETHYFHVSIGNSASVGQSNSIVLVHSFIVSIHNSARLSHLPFVNSPRVLSVSNYGVVTQTQDAHNATFYVTASSTGIVTQIVRGHNGIFKVSVTNTFTAQGRAVSRDQIIIVSMGNTLTVKQRVNSIYRLIVSNTLTVSSHFVTVRYIATQYLSDTQTLSETYSFQRYVTHQLSDYLTLTESYVRSGEYERDLSDIQVLTDTYRQAIVVGGGGYVYDPYPVGPGQPPVVISPHPVATGTPVIQANQTYIESQQGSIYLPVFEFGDSFGPKIQTTVKKTMTGKLYTYIRTNVADKFTLTWILGLRKAYELRAFFEANIQYSLTPTNYYTIYFWNGEIWQAKLISSDIPLDYNGRWQNSTNNNSEIEKLTVVAQFEGTRLL